MRDSPTGHAGDKASARSVQPASTVQPVSPVQPFSTRRWRWKIGVASAAVGAGAVVSGLRADLDQVPALVTAVVLVLIAALALRGVHHRVDQERARAEVFYTGDGSTAWFWSMFVGLVIAPALLVSWIPDAGWRAVLAGVLGATAAAASHAVLSATTTHEEQPTPDPVPLDR